MDKFRLMHNVLMNRVTDAEKIELEDWLAVSESNRMDFDDMRILYDEIWKGDSGTLSKETDWIRITNEIKSRKQQQYKRKAAWSIAAALVITASVFVWVTQSQKVHRDSSQIVLTDNLRFENASLQNVFDLIEEKYDVVLFANKELLSCKFTGTFHRGITLTQMINTLAKAENFRYSFSGRKMEIIGKGC
ncbi:MAG TPA: DUF4974 domain-containing protein [Cyclobacteriaceae bacterium]|nr:DUF4974 domain-containing protein [Cyclobacteriaceae bacterium]HRF35299.1 DUF4974 domain-containing protein [Cyclobacteriaceae bacterium]